MHPLDKELQVWFTYPELRFLGAVSMNSILVKFDDEQREDGKYLTGKLIMPDQVREETGTYWGYSLRLAKSIK